MCVGSMTKPAGRIGAAPASEPSTGVTEPHSFMGFSDELPRPVSVAPIRGLVSFGTSAQGSLRFALGFIPSPASRTETPARFSPRPPNLCNRSRGLN